MQAQNTFNRKDIHTPVQFIKGVGPKKAELLAKLDIHCVKDLLYYLPRRYEDRSVFTPIRQMRVGQYYTVNAKVLSTGIYSTKKGIPVLQLRLGDGTGSFYCVWFNMVFLAKNFKAGQDIIVYGRLDLFDKLQMSHPDYEILKDGEDPVSMGKIVPVYSLTEDVTQKYLRGLVSRALEGYAGELQDVLPDDIRKSHDLADIRFAINNIHFPDTMEDLDKSYRRIVFEEFLMLQIALARKKAAFHAHTKGLKHDIKEGALEEFLKLLSFKLTSAQERVMNEIARDMAGSKAMNRLLQGDVGSGKTVVSMYALYLTVKNGYQGVIMAPTEILARQHYVAISGIFMPLGINVRLLISGLEDTVKSQIKAEVKNGDVDIICGTHALIQEDVNFNNLGLAVIDEQHKFGVNQRSAMKSKGPNAHMLAMTATPIPRTLALTIYGDMDLSVIDELPQGRKPVTTFFIEENKREQVYKFIDEEIKKGRQVFMVYPRITTDDESEVKSAESMYGRIQEHVFPQYKVGLIHGKMAAEQKSEIMSKFKTRKYDILVSTVVIEVGLDIPNASLMVIENAERFGLAQLHQLRGRIGRGGHDSYCILIGDHEGENAERRFSKMLETQDGFEIAEEDLQLRGPGEFLGKKQHGLPEIRFGNILKDFEIMENSRKAAFEIVSKDPGLTNPDYCGLKKNMQRRFEGG